MKRILLLLLLITIFSCEVFKPKDEHRFIYGFETQDEVSDLVIKQTIVTLGKRLKAYGSDCQIKPFAKNQLELVIKASKLNIERFDNIISNKGKLEFWELYPGKEFQLFLSQIDSKVEGFKSDAFLELITSIGYDSGPMIFYFKASDTSYVNSVLSKENLISDLPFPRNKVKFLWGKTDNTLGLPLYAAKLNRGNRPPLTGTVITNAAALEGITGKPEITMQMNKDGALIWERLTGNAFINQTYIAITLNDLVYSAPGVTVGAIKGGNSSISGDFTVEEAEDISRVLGSGASIPKLKLLEHTISEN